MSFYARYAGIFGGGGGGGGGTAPAANIQAIGNGDTSVTVSFGTPFVSTPVVVAWVTSSNVAADFIPIQGISVTVNGFVAVLGTATTDATYTLNWIASAVND